MSAIEALLSSKSDQWFTPAKYVDAAREVLGVIDLDPASCEAANHTVRAARFFDLHSNGLLQEWLGRVFLNPPYGPDMTNRWVKKLLGEYHARHLAAAILLVPNNTSAGWFKPLWDFPLCFTDHRIHFIGQGAGDAPTHGNVFVYFGAEVGRFTAVFSRFGAVVMRRLGEREPQGRNLNLFAP